MRERSTFRDYPKVAPPDLVVAILTREAAQHSVPPLEWHREKFAKLPRPQPVEGTANIDDTSAFNQEIRQTYIYKVREWYRRVGVIVRQRYERERWFHRTFYLKLKVSNAGQAPAERVKLQCVFPSDLVLNENEPTIYAFTNEAPQQNEEDVPIAIAQEREFPQWSFD